MKVCDRKYGSLLAARAERFAAILFFAVLLSACAELEKPTTEPFYAETAPPQKREFRWSNGKMPKSFDPAVASAPPESDVVRALFDGLTELDQTTLEAKPSLALEWESADEGKTWIFRLRKDAKWSNGERVTANDIVRSWERIMRFGDQVPQRRLFDNIAGMERQKEQTGGAPQSDLEELLTPAGTVHSKVLKNQNVRSESERPTPEPAAPTATPKSETEKKPIGAVAVDAHTLKVTLNHPDEDFPKLVALPVFRPVFGDGSTIEGSKLDAAIVTNGPFRIVSVGQDGVTLDRSEDHWDRAKVEIERVKFVPKESAEKALEAYRTGEIDAVTNALFEPLALKLLRPFEDFRQSTHSALNFYQFNEKRVPFGDRRVRTAMSIAIDRERLTDGELEGAMRPAFSFLPFTPDDGKRLSEDPARARKLLEEAGFPNGENFPEIKLVVNRNDVQLRVARLVAKMWEQELNIRTQIVSVETSEIEAVRVAGDFDLIRRGVVLPSADEMSSMTAIFPPGGGQPADPDPAIAVPAPDPTVLPTPELSAAPHAVTTGPGDVPKAMDQDTAISEMPAVPLYFPISYSLVKPYVIGFGTNVFDAPLLKDVRIDTGWQPKKPKSES